MANNHILFYAQPHNNSHTVTESHDHHLPAVETADAASITSISPSQVPVVQQPAVTLGDSLLYDTDRNQPNNGVYFHFIILDK